MITRRALLTSATAVAAFAPFSFARPAHARFVWADPGAEPFLGDTTHIRRMGISKSVQDVALALVEMVVIRRHALKGAMERDSPDGKALWTEKFAHDKNVFYIVPDLMVNGVPPDMLERLVAKLGVVENYDGPMGKISVGHLKPEEDFDFMAFGANKMVDNVVYHPGPNVRERVHPLHRHGEELRAYVLQVIDPGSGQGATIVMPFVCRNLALKMRQVDMAQFLSGRRPGSGPALIPQLGPGDQLPGLYTPPADAARRSLRPAWIARSSEPDGCVMQIVVDLWDAKTRRRGMPVMVSGVNLDQSRDHGAGYRAAAERGDLAPFDGVYPFKIYFSAVRAKKLQGRSYGMNGVERHFPSNFGDAFGPDHIMVEVIRGEGVVEITYKQDDLDTSWLTPTTVLDIASPWGVLPYPESGGLRTCGPNNLARQGVRTPTGQRNCGRASWAYPQWEFPKLVFEESPCGRVHFHFVK